MRFCSSCGGQLEEGSHFCEKCGTAQPGQPAGAPAVPVPAPQVAIPPQPGQPFAGVPPQYPPPVIMGAPPGAQPTAKNPMMWVIGAGVIFGLWYIGTHDNNTLRARHRAVGVGRIKPSSQLRNSAASMRRTARSRSRRDNGRTDRCHGCVDNAAVRAAGCQRPEPCAIHEECDWTGATGRG